jgi:hypothetical protein
MHGSMHSAAVHAVALLTLSFTCFISAQEVKIAPDGDGLQVMIDGTVFTRYATSGSQRPHMYPLMGANGAALTRTYPSENKSDHPHHSSVWIGHGLVNGIDFWADGEKHGRIQHRAFAAQQASGNTASFTATSDWIAPSGETIMSDERVIAIRAEADGTRILDWTITLKASAGEVVLGDTKEGTMAIRVAPILSIKEGKGHMLSSAGLTDKKVWGTRAEWVSFHGADPKGAPVAITMMDHPTNLRHPTTWHARDYGLFAANPFGLHDFEKKEDKTLGNHTLPKGGSLTQRYRILIQSGEPDAAKLGAAFQAFVKP